jgi:NAD(P)-dependent dehydrogenase (short-subunit alcohol dehydrogenase family)
LIEADGRKEDDVRNMVDKTVARFGHLNVAVNNAASEREVAIRPRPRTSYDSHG